ncbi:MAG TPA: hypothetical protein VIW45_14035 [Vicinamibacterales bacterium]
MRMAFMSSIAAMASVVCCAVPAHAQSDATGHWKGSVQVQAMQVEFVVDIAKTAHDELVGTIGLPAQRIQGLPLQKIALDAKTVTFWAREDQPFRGTLGDDGTIAGDMTIEGLVAPFTMTRTGDAAIDAPPRSTGIAKELAGTWTGALEAGGRQLRLVLRVDPQTDGTVVAEMIDLDEGGLRSPLKLAQQGSSVTIESIAVPATISCTLSADANELRGTFTQGTTTLPLTFRHGK